MARYAQRTTVPVERSRGEIEGVLQRYGATAFAYATDHQSGKSQIQFAANGRLIRFTLPMPERDALSGPKWEQECRSRWRALVLSIKAKLEAVECGISQFESEFLANIVNPANGRTVYEEAMPQIAASYAKKPAPLLLTVE